MAASFLWKAGATDGFTVAPFNLLSSELNGKTTGQTALSLVGGTAGVFSNANTGRVLMGPVTFVAGGSFTPSAGAYIEGWFLDYGDNVAAEKFVTNVGQARSPDFLIPLHASAYSAGQIALCNGRRVSIEPIRFMAGARVVNANLPASGNKIMFGGIEVEI